MPNPKKRKLVEVSGVVAVPHESRFKRRKTELSELQQLFASRGGVKQSKQTKDVSPLWKLQKSLYMKRCVSEELQALVIYLRFGSLNHDANTWLSSTEVFRRTGVKPTTQCAIIKRWRAREFTIVRCKSKGRMRSLSEDEVR